MTARRKVLGHAGPLPHRQLAADEAPHLCEHPRALGILRPLDRPVGVGVKVLRPEAVTGAQRQHAHAIGGHAHRRGDHGGGRAFDGRVPQHLLVALRQAPEGRPDEVVVDGRGRVIGLDRRCRRLERGILGRDGAQLGAGGVDGGGAHG